MCPIGNQPRVAIVLFECDGERGREGGKEIGGRGGEEVDQAKIMKKKI